MLNVFDWSQTQQALLANLPPYFTEFGTISVTGTPAACTFTQGRWTWGDHWNNILSTSSIPKQQRKENRHPSSEKEKV